MESVREFVGGGCRAGSGVQRRPGDGVPVVSGGSIVGVPVDDVMAGGAVVGASSEAGGEDPVGCDDEEIGSSAVVWVR